MSADTGPQRVMNFGGGAKNAMSLAELSGWCCDRYESRQVSGKSDMRRFDIPWLIMDATKAKEIWDWQPQTPINDILEEIALHAEQHPGWLELSGPQ